MLGFCLSLEYAAPDQAKGPITCGLLYLDGAKFKLRPRSPFLMIPHAFYTPDGQWDSHDNNSAIGRIPSKFAIQMWVSGCGYGNDCIRCYQWNRSVGW